MKAYILNLFLLLVTVGGCFSVSAQNATVYGKVIDENGRPIEMVNIVLDGMKVGAVSDAKGKYELKVPVGVPLIVRASFVGYLPKAIPVASLSANERYQLDMKMVRSISELPKTEIVSELDYDKLNYQKIPVKHVSVIPSPGGGGVEALIKTLPGVASNNELSSQYSVRGGNFDENLVYVNDIEVYRPFLVRSGQQEGLSFINSDMVESITFSAGGFEARYGDKMSSVLDIGYRRPYEFGGSFSLGMLGESALVEGMAKNSEITYMVGVRHKSNQYLLNSMETKGDYKPSFLDVQTSVVWDITNKWQLNFIGSYSGNEYRVVPTDRETRFGTLNDALRLKIYFDGQESDRFNTWMGGLVSTHTLNKNLKLKFIGSAFRSFESETFDILGQYWLDELEVDLGKDQFGDVAFNRGIGSFLNHARNYLDAAVVNLEHKGYYHYNRHNIQWGAKVQYENVYDKLNEWNLLDSADYSLPHNPDSVGYTNPDVQPEYQLEIQDVVKSVNNLISYRTTAYLQDAITLRDVENRAKWNMVVGLRAHYWDVNKQFVLSPRMELSCKPFKIKRTTFRFSSGYYYQPPFYREIRDFEGKLHTDVKAQQSIHFLLGGDYSFKAWKRPFKLTAETYYKILNDLITYEVDNVRIRYYANNNSHGYAYGADMKINGEFVKGVESWLSVGVMKTFEDVVNDYYILNYNSDNRLIIPGYSYNTKVVRQEVVRPGYVPRPTDQRVNVNLFFQDYLPIDSTFKMHLNLVFGSRLPFGPPTMNRYSDTLRIPPYRRVDIGFSKQLLSEKKELSKKNPLHNFKSIWITAEVFNLLQINNIISYMWVKDVTNRTYAIPNYLTPRQLNIRLIAKF